jgi:hypothetical protein
MSGLRAGSLQVSTARAIRITSLPGGAGQDRRAPPGPPCCADANLAWRYAAAREALVLGARCVWLGAVIGFRPFQGFSATSLDAVDPSAVQLHIPSEYVLPEVQCEVRAHFACARAGAVSAGARRLPARMDCACRCSPEGWSTIGTACIRGTRRATLHSLRYQRRPPDLWRVRFVRSRHLTPLRQSLCESNR